MGAVLPPQLNPKFVTAAAALAILVAAVTAVQNTLKFSGSGGIGGGDNR